MRYPRGSTWNKWDLHVHTPASVIQGYGGDNEEVWERFLREIELLPSEFKVLGINDYIFVDGYRRVLEAKRGGRLQNIDLLLPVIEIRLNQFGGSESRLSRVNYHIIFSDEVSPDVIEHHFLYALSTTFVLTPESEKVVRQKRWSSNITRESVEELGNLLIETTPQDKRTGALSPLHKGFSNLTFNLEDVKNKLQSHQFEGRYLTAIGKSEWADIKWNGQNTADKKHLINNASIVFTASNTPEGWRQSKDALWESGVTDRLLDCSDAHFFSTAVDQKDRLGNCYTWIKAAPTFEGLKHALRAPDERIFVGEEPEKVKRVRENKTKYVDSLSLSKASGLLLDEVWFEDELKFSTDFVAIIGKKGSGKSALVDILGLAGDTRQSEAFSFLNTRKFTHPKDNKAQHFEATLTWKSGKRVTRKLDDSVSEYAVETIKYIPQSYLEKITNEVASGEGEHFRRELEAVIFSHVGEAERLGMSSLDELIRYKTQETYEAIEALKEELRTLNADIVRLEGQSTEEHRRELEKRLVSRKEELAAHAQAKPPEVLEPKGDPTTRQRSAAVSEELEQLKLQRELLSALIAVEEEQQKELARLVSATEKAFTKVENIEHRYRTGKEGLSEDLNDTGISIGKIVELKVNLTPLREVQELYRLLKDKTDESLDLFTPEGYYARRTELDEEITALQEQLDEPHKEYEEYLSSLEDWKAKQREILGTEDAVGSVTYLEDQIKELDEIPVRLQEVLGRRREKAREIFREIRKLADTYRTLYGPVQKFIEEHALAKDQFDLNFEVAIVEENFEEKFFDQVNRGKIGSFCGKAESSTLLNDILDKHDFQDEGSTLDFLDRIMEDLHYDMRAKPKRRAKVPEQLKQGYTAESLYNFVFSLEYLKPRYTLRMGDKELDQLSPGERGTLLLIFYLLVDKDDVPLVIDQPEENLDNETIFELLVPCIREAKKRRQLFLVTHNPNLAVTGNAEQIIRASIDKKRGNRITYTAGPLEDSGINEMTVDILEGTRPAFDNRGSKYSTGRER